MKKIFLRRLPLFPDRYFLKFYVINTSDNLSFQPYYNNKHTTSLQKMYTLSVVQFMFKKTSPTGLWFTFQSKSFFGMTSIQTPKIIYDLKLGKERSISTVFYSVHIILLGQNTKLANSFDVYISWKSIRTNTTYLTTC